MRATQSTRRGFQVMRDLPLIGWFVAIVVVAIAHQWIPAPRWLLIHLVFLGAATHAILVWSQHFAAAVLRRPSTDADRRALQLRLIVANVGVVAVAIGVPAAIWPLTVSGAVLVAGAAIWHGISLVRRMRGALPGQFSGVVRYYVASAACLPIGAGIGAWIAGPGGADGRLVLSHALINVLGWLGLTVAGTLVTLWPTMLRTRADTVASVGAARALPPLTGATLISAVGAAAGITPLVALGLLAYVVGLCIIGISLWRAARADPPRTFPTLSVGTALLWWIGCLVVLLVAAVRASFEGMVGATDASAGIELSGVEIVRGALADVAPYLAAGFAAQLLIGALSYLIPVVLGGGPAAAKAGSAAFSRGAALRVTVANTALLVCALPVSSLTRVIASMLYLVAVASFLPIMVMAMRAQLRMKRSGAPAPASGPQHADRAPAHVRAMQVTAGVIAVALTVAVGAGLDARSLTPVAGGTDSVAAAADAPVVTVEIEATAGMRFTPDRIEVPAGSHLIIELTNTDPTHPHDLVLETGASSDRLAPGEHTTIDAGIITGDTEGWCSLVGHRQQGMVLDIVAIGATSEANGSAAGQGEHADHATGGSGNSLTTSDVDLAADPGENFVARDAALPPLEPADGPVTREVTLRVSELVGGVAPGVEQELWTFGGTAPGPVLHGRVGDRFEVTLINDGTIGHSIDFHAGALAPDGPMRTIASGEELVYSFTATRAGIWMYHCSTHPMSVHIASGMFGAVVIEPEDLPEVEQSYLLVQSEHYLGEPGGQVDADKIAAEQPDLVSFNGYASQYDHDALTARVGERVRVWVLDAGPNRPSSFHVIGGQFDTVWFEGSYLIGDATGPSVGTGSQALGLQPAQGGFIELEFPEVGNYPFVSHLMIDAERGAHGIFEVGE
ncbi:MAG: multicopper oxidase domain-containing protein [Leucobacter sp.]